LVDRPGWTGSCLAFARADFPKARARAEVGSTGVYVLVGPNPDGTRTQHAYIGEADDVRTRLDSHQKEKDFWTHGYILSTKDNSLNKAHVRYLEARLIQLARAVDNATLDNGTAPPIARLSEPEVADMEAYLENALMILPLVGVNIFDLVQEQAPTDRGTDSRTASVRSDGEETLFLQTQLTTATGREDARGFLVHEGALGRRDTKVMVPGYERLRTQLIEEGVLVNEGDDQIRLTKNFLFDSPSAAASVLSGGNKNGRTEWRNTAGRTLKELQAETASDPATGSAPGMVSDEFELLSEDS
jgi:hypothetical protein